MGFVTLISRYRKILMKATVFYQKYSDYILVHRTTLKTLKSLWIKCVGWCNLHKRNYRHAFLTCSLFQLQKGGRLVIRQAAKFTSLTVINTVGCVASIILSSEGFKYGFWELRFFQNNYCASCRWMSGFCLLRPTLYWGLI